MTVEKTNTSGFELFPEGHYKFIVSGRPEKFKTAKSTYRRWKFSYVDGNDKVRFTNFLMFPWESEQLLLAVGGKKAKDGTIEWDDEMVDNKCVECDIVHEIDNRGEKRAKLKNAVEGIPF